MVKRIFCWMITAALLSSCAVIMNGPNALVTLEGPTEDTLTIETNVKTYEHITLPQKVKVRRNYLEEPIIVRSDTAVLETIMPGSRLNTAFWCNLLSWGLPGMVVDMATGAANSPLSDVYLVNSDSKMAYLPTQRRRKPNIYRHEINVNISVGAVIKGEYSRMRNQLDSYLEAGQATEAEYWSTRLFASSIGLGYFYHLNEHWAVGAIYGKTSDCNEARAWFSDDEAKLEDLYSRPYSEWKGHEYGGIVRVRSRWLMPAVKWTWYRGEIISFFTKAALGLQRQTVWLDGAVEKPSPIGALNRKRWLPAWQLTPLGFELGRHRFRYFMDFGYGLDCGVKFGITYLLGHSRNHTQ